MQCIGLWADNYEKITEKMTDGQTDKFTMANTALSIASYADAL